MAITKLTGFHGEAEVMGRMVRVSWDTGVGLHLEGLGYEDAMLALDTLSAKYVEAVNPLAKVTSQLPGAKSASAATTPAPNGQPKKERILKLDVVEATSGTLESAKVLPDKTVAEPIQEVVTPSTVAKDLVKGLALLGGALKEEIGAPVTVTVDAKPQVVLATSAVVATATQPATETLKAPDGVVPDIKQAKQLKEVLSILQLQGITIPGALVAKCEEIKNDVPVLSRIANIKDRVLRTLELMSPTPAA
jgi:hypothetical protein